MGKHLDHLVDQTEKFSTALAFDIQVRGAVNPFEEAPFNSEKKPAPLPSWRNEIHTSSLLSLSKGLLLLFLNFFIIVFLVKF